MILSIKGVWVFASRFNLRQVPVLCKNRANSRINIVNEWITIGGFAVEVISGMHRQSLVSLSSVV
jgi:hypothetical protein